MEPKKAQTLVISGIRDQARITRSFDLRPERVVDFTPGQVAILRVEGEEPAYFALAGAPGDRDLEVLVKQKVGASRVIYDMGVGGEIELLDVCGRGFTIHGIEGVQLVFVGEIEWLDVGGRGFRIDEMKGCDLVFVAMGTGVAPLRSALRHVLKRKSEFGQLVVLYGARTPDDFCYRDETEAWENAGVELRQVISRPDGHDWSGPTGYVQSLLDNVLPDLASPVALIC